MALTCGFFNAQRIDPGDGSPIEYDRVYGSETFNEYFEGIVNTTGVFRNYGDAFAAKASDDGQKIIIGSGKALLLGRWVKIDGVEELDILPMDIAAQRNRTDVVVLRLNTKLSVRNISLVMIKGPEYSGQFRLPVFKEIIKGNSGNNTYKLTSEGIFDLPIAAIDRRVGSTGITDANIMAQDILADGSGYSNYISHLVNTPEKDIDAIMAKYFNTFNDYILEIINEGNVNTHIQSFNKHVDGGNDVSTVIPLNMPNYFYGSGDVFIVNYNGLMLGENDYEIDASEKTAQFILKRAALTEGNELDIKILKSQVGVPIEDNGDEKRY